MTRSEFSCLVFALIVLHLLMFVGGELLGADESPTPIVAPGMTDVVMPADAKMLLTAEADAEAKAKATYDAAVAKLRADLAPKLVKAQENATRHGDLDGAMSIKKAIEDLGAGKVKTASKPPAHDDTGGGKYVVLYNETNYGGLKIKVPVPTEITQVGHLGFPNDALRSIQIPAGVTVHLYDSDNGGGKETILTESMDDLFPLTHAGTTSLSAKR